MRVRLFVDEDAMADALMTGLRARGVDLLTASAAGTRRLEDDEQIEFAAAHGRVLYTFNTSDFYRLHTAWTVQGKRHAEIIFAPQTTLLYRRANAQAAKPDSGPFIRRDDRQH